jgi:hypothetical protein
MSKDNTYNGWTNYETWNLKLWLDNSISDFREKNVFDTNFIQGNIKKICKKQNSEKDTIYEIYEYLKNYVEKGFDNMYLKPSFYCDVLSASIREVNFYEIAESYYEDYIYESKSA